MMVGEAPLLGVASTAAGVAAGLVVGVILVEVVNRQSFGWSLSLELPWADVAGLAAWVVIACVLAGLAPAAAALALQPAEVLCEER
jgi:putative ABC transport system permease protein